MTSRVKLADVLSGGSPGTTGPLGVAARVLGPLEITVDGRPVDLSAGRLQTLFAVLAVSAGRVVSMDRITAALWNAGSPLHTRRAVQTYMARLRAALGDGAISTESTGYVLHAEPDQVDAIRFAQLIEAADRATDPAATRDLLDQALRLWRGTPFEGVPSDLLSRHGTRLVEQLLAAVEWRADLWLAGDPAPTGDPDATDDRPADLLARLRELVESHPLRESLWVRLLMILQRCGRQAEALDRYEWVRVHLAEELGTDPGPDLQRVYTELLTGPGPAADARPDPTARPVPRQLPAPPQVFIGRIRELATLEQAGEAPTVVISAVDGMAGIGKTALAVYAAHRIADRYPDGQLFIDLYGHTPGMAPREPADALEWLLRALSVPGAQLPSGLDERSALYRTRLAGRRMLILLDNAATEAQVAPLLPGSPGCRVLITSRRRLVGLDNTVTLSLDTLSTSDAIRLFSDTTGPDRLKHQPRELVAELVELCGRLPLALRVAAARLRSHSAWHLSYLVRRLRDQQHRLAELAAGQRSVRAALDVSYQHLDADQQRAYRLVGLHPGADIDPHAAAALLDSTVAQARRVLDQLLDAHLLQEPAAGRYRFHDLTRAHALHTADQEQTPAMDAAVRRLSDFYRHTAAAAMNSAYAYEREHRPEVPPAHTPVPDLSDPETALGWLDTEMPNLLAVAGCAVEHNIPSHLQHLSATLHRHLCNRGQYHDAESLHHQALSAARAAQERDGEVRALTGLGRIHWIQGRNAPAHASFEQALHLARAVDHRAGQLDALNGLGQIHWIRGRPEQAGDHFEQALLVARAAGHRAGELDALTGLGRVRWMQGRHDQAADHYEQVRRIAGTIGHQPGELYALAGLGQIHMQQDRHDRAVDCYRQALRIAQVTGHQTGQLAALTGLGQSERRRGRHERATRHLRQLLALALKAADRNYEFEARQGLGRLAHATGDPIAATGHHKQALVLADTLEQPLDQARAHDGLAHANHALGQHEQAREHWQHALDTLTKVGIDHTDDQETTIAALRARLERS